MTTHLGDQTYIYNKILKYVDLHAFNNIFYNTNARYETCCDKKIPTISLFCES